MKRIATPPGPGFFYSFSCSVSPLLPVSLADCWKRRRRRGPVIGMMKMKKIRRRMMKRRKRRPRQSRMKTMATIRIRETMGSAVPIERLQQATVLILAQQVMNGRPQTIWTGSGTILTPDGIILTNAHVAAPTAPGLATLYNDPEMLFSDELDQIVISMVERADQLPEERYIAELRAADGPLDLAVLEIVSDMDGNPVGKLDLPYVEIGDSDDIRLGDEVRVLGYPGAGGSTITFTRGNVSGFESQDFVGDRAWIKTDSTISPGNSGGLGVNEAGQIVGVPSFVQEAMGGAINRMRSINYALPMLEAVADGRDYSSPYVVDGGGNESFELVTWADDFFPIHSAPSATASATPPTAPRSFPSSVTRG
jgi:S1-C subfamily serine protease